MRAYGRPVADGAGRLPLGQQRGDGRIIGLILEARYGFGMGDQPAAGIDKIDDGAGIRVRPPQSRGNGLRSEDRLNAAPRPPIGIEDGDVHDDHRLAQRWRVHSLHAGKPEVCASPGHWQPELGAVLSNARAAGVNRADGENVRKCASKPNQGELGVAHRPIVRGELLGERGHRRALQHERVADILGQDVGERLLRGEALFDVDRFPTGRDDGYDEHERQRCRRRQGQGDADMQRRRVGMREPRSQPGE